MTTKKIFISYVTILVSIYDHITLYIYLYKTLNCEIKIFFTEYYVYKLGL